MGFAVAVLLLVSALVVVWRQRGMLIEARVALGDAHPMQLVILAGAIIANVILTGLVFSVLIARYGSVGLFEMQCLIAAATLMNFLPLRPGLFGRVAYHRAVNRIPAADTIRTIIEALIISSAVAAVLVVVAASARWLNVSLPLGVAVPPAGLAIAALHPASRRWALAGLLRYADLLAWAVRYSMVFALIDAPISHETALALACVAAIANLVPFVSNGLGIREWAVGLLAPFLADWPLELGLTAELVNRAAEVIVIVILGLGGVAVIGRKAAKRRSVETT